MKYIEKQKQLLLDILTKPYLTHCWPVIVSDKLEYVWRNKEAKEQADALIKLYNYFNSKQEHNEIISNNTNKTAKPFMGIVKNEFEL